MSPEKLVYVAVVVFVLMLIGLALTVIDFRRGAPKQQLEEQKRSENSQR